MANKFIESMLEETITAKNKAGLSELDERRLRKSMDKSGPMIERNQVKFEREEPRFSTCSMYNPCPICDKCLNKGSHLFKRCETCKIPMCIHTYNDKKKMIRRENFTFKTNPVWERIIATCTKPSEG